MYATVEQANAYIKDYYASTDSIRTQWEALTEEDKRVMLNRASQVVDLLPYKGRPVHPGKAFPRKPNEEYSLQMAMTATIELAAQQFNTEAKERFELQSQGVKSYKIGDLSETFGNSQGASGYSGIDEYSFSIVFPYLKDWLGGGYEICHTHIKRCHGRHVIR